MRIAVVSDTHFGDDLCTLVRPGPGGGAAEPGPGHLTLRRAVGHVDYLVLLGDVIDLSVASYEDAYRAAKAFFVALLRDGLAREIVYVPGDHDFDIWNVVEQQVNVINQVKQGTLRFSRTFLARPPFGSASAAITAAASPRSKGCGASTGSACRRRPALGPD